ncbi:YhcB family protein [Psychromonas sp. PT13]|uniref:YhcB family protein n=1 Tax=Psychromonas sp. PT13 TaxID=3439547 RepID=UPI003EB789B6
MNETNEIVTFLFTFVAGGIIGFIISHFGFASKKQSIQQKEIEANKAELDAYKAKVNNHFNDSAELMGKVASSYQELYNHMADQSQTLLDEENNAHFPLLNTPAQTELEEETVESDPALGDIEQIDIDETTAPLNTDETIDEDGEKEAVSNEDDTDTVKEQPADVEETTTSEPEDDEIKSEQTEETPVKVTEEKK